MFEVRCKWLRRFASPLRALSIRCAIVFSTCSYSVAQESFADAAVYPLPANKFLVLTADALNAIILAKKEALNQNLRPEQMSLVTVLFEQDKFVVGFLPPYDGGLDGPEFKVVIRRSDFKVLAVVNHSELIGKNITIKDILIPVVP
jgi:hypothetical protein